jgi:hypothetical protein
MGFRMEKGMHDKMVRDRGKVDMKIDAVARAICKSRTCEGVNCCQWPSQGSRKSDCPVSRGGYDDAAKAAIGAMQELSLLPIAL